MVELAKQAEGKILLTSHPFYVAVVNAAWLFLSRLSPRLSRSHPAIWLESHTVLIPFLKCQAQNTTWLSICPSTLQIHSISINGESIIAALMELIMQRQ